MVDIVTYLLNRGIGDVIHGTAQPVQRIPGIKRDDRRGGVVVHVIPVFHDRGRGSIGLVTATVSTVVVRCCLSVMVYEVGAAVVVAVTSSNIPRPGMPRESNSAWTITCHLARLR